MLPSKPMHSMIEVLANHANTQPDILYGVDKDGPVTYGEALLNVCRVMTAFRAAGLHAGDCVAVECSQNLRFLLTELACEWLGLIFVPVERQAAPERIQDILTESEARLYVYFSKPVEQIPSMEMSALFDAEPTEELPDFPKGDEIAEILFSTGTTGKSKGIEITHRNDIALAENIYFGAEQKDGNVEIIPLPLSHSHALRCAYSNLLGGNTVIILDGLLNMKRFFGMMEEYHVTAIDLSPSAAQILMKLSKNRLRDYAQQLDYVEVGTAFLPEETKDQLIDLLPGVRLYNFYGSTEAGRNCVLDFQAVRGRPGCIGKPAKNAQIIFVDEEHHEITTSPDQLGLLAVYGSMNMRGYLKQPELTASVLQNGWLFTSDLGYIDGEGYVYVLGRAGDVINFGGIKISPEEIEEVVCKYPAVKDCACVPKKDAIAGQVPKLFVSLKEGVPFDMADLQKYLWEHLDNNKQPKEVAVIDEIPRTFNGKLQRGKLVEK